MCVCNVVTVAAAAVCLCIVVQTSAHTPCCAVILNLNQPLHGYTKVAYYKMSCLCSDMWTIVLCNCVQDFNDKKFEKEIPKLQLDWLCNFDDHTKIHTLIHLQTVHNRQQCMQIQMSEPKFRFISFRGNDKTPSVCVSVCVCARAFVIHFNYHPYKKSVKRPKTQTHFCCYMFYVFICAMRVVHIFSHDLSFSFNSRCARTRLFS